jgi:hypothetical protein
MEFRIFPDLEEEKRQDMEQVDAIIIPPMSVGRVLSIRDIVRANAGSTNVGMGHRQGHHC